jgi:hypothetical protein
MKHWILFSFMLVMYNAAKAQLKVSDKCGTITIDILDGKINGMRPNRAYEEFKEKLPCFTSAVSESDSSACGGMLSFKDKDFIIYTTRDYIEIGPAFKGKLTLPLMGAKKGSLFNHLGNPKLKDANWEAYQTNYGLLILYYSNNGTVNKIQFSTKSAETIEICGQK